MSQSINGAIAWNIVHAQMASDAGKSIYDVNTSKSSFDNETRDLGYLVKDAFIMKAIQLIQMGNNSFCYYIEARPDQNGNDSFVIYFETKLYGKAAQISFHSFAKKWQSYLNKGRKTHWDRNIGGSRKNCKKLIDFYNL